jgi:hypothetical protein
LTAQSSCRQCEAGFYCNAKKMTTNLVECTKGNYCPAGAKVVTNCPIGTYMNELNAKSEADCKPCLPGFACPSPGIETPSVKCTAGYFCKKGSSSATPALDNTNGNFGPCPAGNYCLEGTGRPLPCPSGTFSGSTNLTQKSDCSPCTAGSYCLQSGLTAVEG